MASHAYPRALVLAALITLAGCDTSAGVHTARVLPYTHSGAPWLIDDAGFQYLVDTGSPRTIVSPAAVGMQAGTFTTQTLPGWSVLELGEGLDVVVTDDIPVTMRSLVSPTFGGILAGDSLADQPFMLDPHRGRLILDDDGDFSEWLSETEPPVLVPIEVRGGGITCMSEDHCFEHEGYRVLVEVEIEGERVLALLDTGASYTGMGEALYAKLAAKAEHPEVLFRRPWDSWQFARVRSVAVGETELANVPVRVNPALDTALARLRVETNRDVELVLGHSLLLHFAVGLDHANERLTLARYTVPRAVETEMFETFGFWFSDNRETHGCLGIGLVAETPEIAAAALEPADCVLAIEGVSIMDMSFEDALRMVEGAAIGDELEFTIVDDFRPGEPSGAAWNSPPRTVTLAKRDLLPRFPAPP